MEKSDRIGCEVDHGASVYRRARVPRRHSYTGRDTEAGRPAEKQAARTAFEGILSAVASRIDSWGKGPDESGHAFLLLLRHPRTGRGRADRLVPHGRTTPSNRSRPRADRSDEAEVSLLAKEMADDGRPIDEDTITKLLGLHGDYVDGRIREAQAKAEASRIEAERAKLAQESAGQAGVGGRGSRLEALRDLTRVQRHRPEGPIAAPSRSRDLRRASCPPVPLR